MSRAGLFLVLLASVSGSCQAATRVTVDQLQQIVTTSQNKSDADIAKQLADLELSERLSAESQ
jgi:predicted FMN-binding regulatory protein PaiB